MADIIVKDRTGRQDVPYNGVTAIRVSCPDGSPKDFIAGEPVPTTIQPNFSDGDIVLFPNDGEVFSKVTVVTPPGLVPENIAKGVTVAGIKGDMVGGSMESKPIRFYNAYGDVVYGFTRAEIREMDALPPGPVLGDLTFDKWTHTLDELKSEVYFADVGPMYKKNGTPAVVLIVRTSDANQPVCLQYSRSNLSTTIYWGDGGTTSITGSGSTTVSHTYSTAREYIISIPMAGTYPSFQLGYLSTYYYTGVAGSSSDRVNTNNFSTTIPTDALISVLDCSKDIHTMVYSLHSNIRLKFVSLYYLTNGMARQFQNCPALKTIAGKPVIRYTGANEFRNTSSLERVALQKTYGSVAENTFIGCDSMKEVMYGNSTITDTTMNSKWAMLMTSETPPKVAATSPKWGTYPIYVPDSAVDAYKAADGWSNVASYIFPASEYPDK